MWGAAIFGLLGVIVGALVTGGVDLVLERRRESNEKARVKRLVAGELQTLWLQLEVATEARITPRVPIADFEGQFLPDELWLANRSALASAVEDDQQYMDLAGMYASVRLLRQAHDELGPSNPLTPNLLTQAKDLRGHIATAYHQLTGATLQDEA